MDGRVHASRVTREVKVEVHCTNRTNKAPSSSPLSSSPSPTCQHKENSEQQNWPRDTDTHPTGRRCTPSSVPSRRPRSSTRASRQATPSTSPTRRPVPRQPSARVSRLLLPESTPGNLHLSRSPAVHIALARRATLLNLRKLHRAQAPRQEGWRSLLFRPHSQISP